MSGAPLHLGRIFALLIGLYERRVWTLRVCRRRWQTSACACTSPLILWIFLDLGQLISFLISSLSVCLSLACGLTRSISLLSSLLHQHLHPSQYVCIDAPTFTFHHAPCAPHPLRFYSATRLVGVTVVLARHTSSLVCRSCILCTFLLRPPHPTHHITHTLRSLE